MSPGDDDAKSGGGDQAKKGGSGCLILFGAVVALFILGTLLSGGEDSSSTQSDSRSEAQKASGLACRHFRNIANDADVLTDAEIREKMKEVHDDANIASPAVRTAAREVLAAITSGTNAEFATAVERLDRACEAAGW
jgi:hypothetical protein